MLTTCIFTNNNTISNKNVCSQALPLKCVCEADVSIFLPQIHRVSTLIIKKQDITLTIFCNAFKLKTITSHTKNSFFNHLPHREAFSLLQTEQTYSICLWKND